MRAAAKHRQDTLTIQAYAEQWLRTRKIRASTLRDYQHLVDDVIVPGLGGTSLSKLTRADVRQWWAGLDASRPRTNAKAYSLLRTILGTAVDEEEIAINPAQIRGAGATKRTRAIEPATLEELETIVEAMPPRLRLAILLGSWCALRYGEIAELRRSDIDFAAGVLKVRRGAVWLKGQTLSGPPKTAAGSRNVAYPPNMEQVIREHIADHAQWGKDGLLFPSSQVGQSSRRRSTSHGTRPGWPLGGRICTSTTSGTPALSWPPRRAPPSRSCRPGWVTPPRPRP